MAFLIRVRGKDGMWRISGLSESSSIADVKARVEELKGVGAATQTLSTEVKGDALDDAETLAGLGVSRGDILHIRYDGSAAPAASASSGRLKIEGGKVVTVAPDESAAAAGRPAMRDIKKQWNWNDFMDRERAFEFTVKQQAEAHCKLVTVDTEMMLSFVRHAQGLAFQTTRFAWLYGFYTEEKKVVAVAAYEPPQEADVDECRLLDDPRADAVAKTAELLGMERVGALYCHPPRHDPDRAFSVVASEVVMAARAQAPAGPGAPFVTVKVSATPEGEVSTEAFQVSDQGCEMVGRGAVTPGSASDPAAVEVAVREAEAARRKEEEAEAAKAEAEAKPAKPTVSAGGRVGRSMSGRVKEAAEPEEGAAGDGEAGTDEAAAEEAEQPEAAATPAAASASASSSSAPGKSMAAEHQLIVDKRFRCVVEGGPSAVVDVAFVLVNVPIAQETYFLHAAFPRASRRAEAGQEAPGPSDVAAHLAAHGRRFGIEEALRDFELLVLLNEQPFLEEAMDAVADAVLDPKAPLNDGHKELLRAFAASV